LRNAVRIGECTLEVNTLSPSRHSGEKWSSTRNATAANVSDLSRREVPRTPTYSANH
jgi:hypothetical protein